MAAEPARSAGPADSYIGSLISLTSKYEIRYEGVLYNINTEESSIGLRNVRSFGTEGRKKDGPQVPPSEKVYEYILFRGSDIKDLQVKSSPPVQAPQPIHHDPAIIQSHYPQPAAASTTFPSAVTGTTNLSAHTSQIGLSGDSTFQGAMPLHQPGGSLGSWGPPSLPPSVNGNGLAMPPMYWQGFYAPQSGHPHLQQQSLLRPSPGMSMAQSGQQPLQYPGINSSLPAGSLTMPTPNFPTSTLPEVDSYLLQPGSSHSPNLFSTSVPSTLPSTVSPAEYASLVSEKSANALPSKIPTGFPTTMGASVPSVTPLTTPILDVNAIAPPTSDKTKGVSGLSLLDQTSSPLLDINSTVSLTSDKAKTVPTSNNAETSAPSLVTPSQLLQPGPRTVSSLVSSELGHKEVEVVQASSSSEKPRASEDTQPPILPLPSRPEQKVNSAPHYHNYHNQNYRGRGRGRRNGILGAPTKFTEDFDFTAMNEKFNKDEVWGDLGKSEKAQLNDNGGDENDDEYSAESSEHDSKPVYVKDDFFDSISSNALDNERRNGRGRFSEQMKLDTETFGNFPRQNHYYHHRGGRGSGRGGRSWGSYNGRGYGYGGRGRGQNMPNRDN